MTVPRTPSFSPQMFILLVHAHGFKEKRRQRVSHGRGWAPNRAAPSSALRVYPREKSNYLLSLQGSCIQSKKQLLAVGAEVRVLFGDSISSAATTSSAESLGVERAVEPVVEGPMHRKAAGAAISSSHCTNTDIWLFRSFRDCGGQNSICFSFSDKL